jgi:Rrf2 family transcriptional regulator, nitric oxide-sensitive transcriptional repressor
MNLNKTTTHAIRLLVLCARAGDTWVKVAELSEALELTPQNTFKIAHLLSRAGFVKALRGRNGGVRLARSAEEIRVGDVVCALELPLAAAAEPQPHTGGPGTVPLIDEAFAAFVAVLNQNTIADMAKSSRIDGPRKKTVKGPSGNSERLTTRGARTPVRRSAETRD